MNLRKPAWLQKPARLDPKGRALDNRLGQDALHTVCSSARCPNRGECYESGVATFMIMGEVCSRACGFCAVATGDLAPLDPAEPGRVAQAAARMNLRHVVVTSVTRDDLPDGGAAHFAATIVAIREENRGATVEGLVPDFDGDPEALRTILAARPDVFNHNVETVPALYRKVRPQADYWQSLKLLAIAKKEAPTGLTKSGFMLGFGESDKEVMELLDALHDAGVSIVTIGQYLRPTLRNLAVTEYSPPERFEHFHRYGEALGITKVFSAPYVRSSYHAAEVFERGRINSSHEASKIDGRAHHQTDVFITSL